MNAALVAAAVYNVHRKKGTRPLKPQDLLRKKTEILSPEDFARRMRAWASEHNRNMEA